jgi:pimeloyl-ACP methyl ester carboxylesterase
MTRWRILGGAGVVLALVYVGVCFFLAQSVTNAERKPVETDPSSVGLAYEDVTFAPRGGDLRLEGWFLAGGAAGSVVFVHGIGSNRAGDDALAIGKELVGRGYDVLLFDLRGHGSSEGGRLSGGYFERADVLGAFDYLLSRGERPERIALLGLSLGAATALMAAAEEPRIEAVIADSPYARASDLIAEEAARRTPIPRGVVPVFLPGANLIARTFYGFDLGDLQPVRAVTRLNYPILLIHGEADKRIPARQSELILARAHPESERWTLPGVGHVDAFSHEPEDYISLVVSYLEQAFLP